MKQAIVAYHKDDFEDWVARLACGHFQHVRHHPPFINRPWVEKEAGRQKMIGYQLNCIKCENGEAKDFIPD